MLSRRRFVLGLNACAAAGYIGWPLAGQARAMTQSLCDPLRPGVGEVWGMGYWASDCGDLSPAGVDRLALRIATMPEWHPEFI